MGALFSAKMINGGVLHSIAINKSVVKLRYIFRIQISWSFFKMYDILNEITP